MHDTVLRASCDAAGGRRLPARSIIHTKWGIAGEVVIAVAWLSDAVLTSDDDVGAEGVAGTVGSIRIACWAGEGASGWVAVVC